MFGVLDGRGGERAQDPAAGRAAAGVDDAAAAVAALEAEREVAAAVGVELDAELAAARATRSAASFGQHLGRGAARQAAAGDQRVLQVQLGRVVDRERGGGAALRPVGGGLGERPGGDERDAGALAGGGQGGEQPGRAGADDDEVGSHAPTRYYGVRDGGELTPRALAARRRRAGPRRARPPGAAGADPGAGGGDERARLVRGAARVEAPEVERVAAGAGAPGVATWRSIEELCAAGGGAIDADTYAVPGTYGAALRACGGAVALVDALLGGEAAVGVSALRPPGHHAEAARAMGFCFFGNVAVAARRATSAHGLSRVLIVDWDVHHGNGTNDIFHADADVLFVSHPRVPAVSGDGAGVRRRFGRGRGLHGEPAGAGRERATRSTARWSSTWRAALIRAWEPELVLISAGFDAHRDDPLATCRVTEAGFAGMAASLRRAADGVGAPLGVVLEGGYDLGALAGSMAAVMPVLVDGVDAGRGRRRGRRPPAGARRASSGCARGGRAYVLDLAHVGVGVVRLEPSQRVLGVGLGRVRAGEDDLVAAVERRVARRSRGCRRSAPASCASCATFSAPDCDALDSMMIV